MLKVVVVDDEKKARTLLLKLLSRLDTVQVEGEAESVETAIPLIETTQPDLVFLDIEMPEANGFELLNHFKEFSFQVVFTTAYSEYAIDAIKKGALDYLLKPIDFAELKACVEKAGDRKKEEKTNSFVIPESFDDKIQSLKIVLPIPKGFKVTRLEDVLYCSASGSYSDFHLTDGKKVVVSKNLKHFEEAFSGYNFIRVHDSYLVNVSHIDSYLRGRGGKVILKNGKELEVSRSRKEELLKVLQG